jgi:hypothetical protein
MKKVYRGVLFCATIIIAMIVAGCQTAPARMFVAPESIENEQIRIDYRIGVHIYYLAITNKSDSDMTIDYSRCSIISVSGQTRTLAAKPEDSHVAPRSTLVIHSDQLAYFGTDLDDLFKLRSAGITLGADQGEKEYLKQFIGKDIRLFIPVTVSGTEKIYDFSLRAVSITQEGTL